MSAGARAASRARGLRDGTVLAVGGLDAADRSVDAIVRVAPGRARRVGRLPVPMSDTSAAAIGDTAHVVGGFTATTPLRSILACRPRRRARVVARLPHPLRYAAVAAVGGRIMVAGGTNGLRGRREVAGGRDARGTVHGEVWSLAVG